jgi:serine/threonine-protein kinase RsbW
MFTQTAMAPANSQLVIQSRPEEIARVEEFIEALNDTFQFRDDVYGNILVAVTEAVNNGIIHGNLEDESKTVTIESKMITPYLMEIVVKDEGDGFDPVASDFDPTDPENLLKESGRGLFVMQHLADSITYSDNGTAVHLQFNI